MNAPLAEMLRFTKWATLTLIDACRGLSDDQLDASVLGVSGSVRVLLTHIVGGQQTFVLRTMGRQHEGELNRASAWPGFDVLHDLAVRSGDDLIAIAERLTDDRDVDLPLLGEDYRFPESFFLLHAVTHGVEHRTEIKVSLARHGIETPDLDAWQYSATAGGESGSPRRFPRISHTVYGVRCAGNASNFACAPPLRNRWTTRRPRSVSAIARPL